MNIVLIHGQNHKGSTYHIGRMIAEKVTAEKAEAEKKEEHHPGGVGR